MSSLLLIYPASFIIFFLLIRKKSNHIVSLAYILMYTIASYGGFSIYEDHFVGHKLYLDGIIFHVLMLIPLLFSLTKFDKIKKETLKKTKLKIVSFLSWIIIFVSLVSIAVDIPNVNFALMMEDVASLRTALMEGQFQSSNFFVRYVTYFGKLYWSIALVLAFYHIRFYPKKRITIILLLISSFSIVVSGFAVAAREYLVKYAVLFLIFYYYFRSDLSTIWKRRLKISFSVVGSFLIGLFLIITFLRFGNRSSSSPFESIISYLSQGFVNFSEFYRTFPDGPGGGALKFPIFVGKSMSGFNMDDSFASTLDLNVFTTTIGSWVFDVGIFVTIFLVVLHVLIFLHVSTRKLTLFKLIYAAWIYEFMFSCLFFYNETINGTRLVSILFILFLDFMSKRSIRSKHIHFK